MAAGGFGSAERPIVGRAWPGLYLWTGLTPIEDSAYDVIRRLITGLGYTEEDIFGG